MKAIGGSPRDLPMLRPPGDQLRCGPRGRASASGRVYETSGSHVRRRVDGVAATSVEAARQPPDAAGNNSKGGRKI